MKQLGIIIVLVLVALGTWIFMGGESTNVPDPVGAKDRTDNTRASLDLPANDKKGGDIDFAKEDEEWVAMEEEPIKPATDLYQNMDQALEAAKKAAAEYDDLVLEQFVNLGPDCTWCDPFYQEITKLMVAAREDSDEKSFFAEMLALSGRPANVETLLSEMQQIKPGSPDFDLYADALEMTTGDEEVVKVLSKHLGSDSQELQESVIAAISNQGSSFAIDLLYRHTKDNGIKDGYYSLGIGLGEVVPNPEAFPLMREIVNKRDEYSPLAIKGLLNAGVDGLRVVTELLENSDNQGNDAELLKDAVDHLPYDDETEKYLRDVVSKSNNPALVEFAQKGIAYLSDETTEK